MHPAARRCSAPTSAPSRPWPTRVRHPPRALFPKPGTFTRRVPPLRVVVRDRLPRGLLYVRHGLGCPNGAHVSRARAPRAGWWPNLDLRWSVGGRSHMGPPRALPVLGLWSRFFVMSASQHDPLSRTTRGSVGEGLKATLYAQTLISWDCDAPRALETPPMNGLSGRSTATRPPWWRPTWPYRPSGAWRRPTWPWRGRQRREYRVTRSSLLTSSHHHRASKFC